MEAQIESATAHTSTEICVSPNEAVLRRERELLRLSRCRVLHDLEMSRHPRHQDQLRRALAALDERLLKFDTPN
ncbi:MAG: hypothetical protein IPM24_10735 [Bryobacterales bacterium]|nr:hypothetical protein [Bryobacterales bacterium]